MAGSAGLACGDGVMVHVKWLCGEACTGGVVQRVVLVWRCETCLGVWL